MTVSWSSVSDTSVSFGLVPVAVTMLWIGLSSSAEWAGTGIVQV